jgi:NDP-sugar pyrophosphorylase family protein
VVSQDEKPAAAGALARTDALVLCGGLGTRLLPVVADRPKGLAEISGRAFLDILVADLVRQGARRIVLCAGHGADQIGAHFRGRTEAQFVLSAEPSPLGTGGALRHALPHVTTDTALVLNGDSFCAVDYAALLARPRGLATIVVVPPDERDDTGAIAMDADGRLLSFAEKPAGHAGRGWVNAGIYLMRRSLIESIPSGPASLEREVFPRAIREAACFGFPVDGPLVDIGTPERFKAAQGRLR